MKKLLVVLCSLSLAGCCSFDSSQVRSSLQLLQSGYDTTVNLLGDPSCDMVDDQTMATMKAAQAAAKVAVPLVDAALNQLGKVLAQKCPAQAEVTVALTKAQVAAQAQAAVPVAAGLGAAAAVPTTP